MTAGHVLVLGASGFVGGRLVAALASRGYRVTCAGRDLARLSRRFPSCATLRADLTRDDAAAWTPRLAGVDAVVNAAGVLRGALDGVHARGAIALFNACARAGVPRVLQISALGAGEQPNSRFLATKAAADEHLLRLAAADGRRGWHVVRPSVVIGRGGASTALFCALAALPVPVRLGPGTWPLQPIHAADLTRILIGLLGDADAPPLVQAVGPEVVTTDQVTAALRGWLGLPPARPAPLPLPLLRLAARVGDFIPGAALTRESLAMLAAGSVACPTSEAPPRPARPLAAALAADPSHPADLLQARLMPVQGVLLACLALVWVGTGAASLLVPAAGADALLAGLGLSGAAALGATRAGAVLDLALGAALARGRGRREVLMAQIALMAAYTALATLALPTLWLDPFGPLLKNLAVLAATLALLALEG